MAVSYCTKQTMMLTARAKVAAYFLKGSGPSLKAVSAVPANLSVGTRALLHRIWQHCTCNARICTYSLSATLYKKLVSRSRARALRMYARTLSSCDIDGDRPLFAPSYSRCSFCPIRRRLALSLPSAFWSSFRVDPIVKENYSLVYPAIQFQCTNHQRLSGRRASLIGHDSFYWSGHIFSNAIKLINIFLTPPISNNWFKCRRKISMKEIYNLESIISSVNSNIAHFK